MAKTKSARSREMVGYMMYAVGVGMPLTTVPQIRQIYSTHVATGLSISTWIMYMFFGLIPLWYAFVNKLKPLIISNLVWMVVDLLMIYGIIRYSPQLIPNEYSKLLLINNLGKALNGLGLFLLSVAAIFFAYDLTRLKRALSQ